MIIACYAGVGKTMYAKLNPSEALDFVCRPYKYDLETCLETDESAKGNSENTLNPQWPTNYVDALESIQEEHKYILIPTDTAVLALLKQRSIPFLLVRPLRNAKEEYRRRFIERENPENSIEIFIDHWDNFMDSLDRIGSCVQITLDIDEYLSDAIDNIDNQAALLVLTAFMMMKASGAIEVTEADGATCINLKGDIFGCDKDTDEDGH